MNPLIQLKRATPVFLIVLSLVWLCLSPEARGVSPAPDGGYPNNNTAEGNDALFSLTTGGNNTANGADALFSNTIGLDNTATGAFALLENTSGVNNTANGTGALLENTSGFDNTATGSAALFNNTTGALNTAAGAFALFFNTTGNQNTASGFEALFSNTMGNNNTAHGFSALFNDTLGSNNTATGGSALFANSTGSKNVANGANALLNNTDGTSNTANGFDALFSNTTGSSNTANGNEALENNTIGSSNTADGVNALMRNTTGLNNTAVGGGALLNNTTGNRNIAVGTLAGLNLTTGDDNIDIVDQGVAGEVSTIRIGHQGTQTNTFVAGIFGTTSTGSPVGVDSTGHLGVLATSSARFKEDIKPMDKVSEAILALKPVTFHYKREIDPAGTSQFGLVAEDVEKINPALITRAPDGKPYTVRYEAVNAMLLNEFLKEHRTVQELKSNVAKQEATIALQQRQIEALTAGLQKVNAQLAAASPSDGGLELGNAGTQMVLNNR